MTPKEQEMRGFDDATNWLVEADGDRAAFKRYWQPPAEDDRCEGCAGTVVVMNECPRCRYDLGFTEGASK